MNMPNNNAEFKLYHYYTEAENDELNAIVAKHGINAIAVAQGLKMYRIDKKEWCFKYRESELLDKDTLIILADHKINKLVNFLEA